MAAWTRPTIGKHSAYTVLGFVGFVVGAIVAGTISSVLKLSLDERVLVICVPPLSFLVTVRLAKRRAGYERIVFYECLATSLAGTALGGLAIGVPLARMLDVVTIGIGVFLILGRLGCFRVACCHGRPCSRGVRYGRAHVGVGFPRIWEGRTVFPIQLLEAGLSLVFVGLSIMALGSPGDACAIYVAGYGLARFGIEELRGDRDRRYVLGLSEGQRMAAFTTIATAVLHPRWWTIAVAGIVLALAGGAFSVRRSARRRLLRASHFHEMCKLLEELPVLASTMTSEGLMMTRYQLPDGRLDCVLSRDAGLPLEDARRIAHLLHFAAEVVPGRVPGLVHVVFPARQTTNLLVSRTDEGREGEVQ